MANIVASAFVFEAQSDGRRQVHELHTDLRGAVHDLTWLAGANDDLNANLAAHAISAGNDLRDGEISANLAQVTANGSLAVLRFVFSTQAQNLAALRAAYQGATVTQAIMIGDFLSSLTDAQLQAIFSMTAGQVTTLRTNKLTPAATNATAIRAATGQ